MFDTHIRSIFTAIAKLEDAASERGSHPEVTQLAWDLFDRLSEFDPLFIRQLALENSGEAE